MSAAAPALLAIYATVAWTPLHTRAVRWHEFEITRQTDAASTLFYHPQEPPNPAFHFFSLAVCERYRRKLVAAWLASPAVPFRSDQLVSCRCGTWQPNPTEGTPL